MTGSGSTTLTISLASNVAMGTYALTVTGSSTNPAITKTAVFNLTVVVPPSVLYVSPNSGTGQSRQFSAAYSDPQGWTNITQSHLLFNSSLSGSYACWVYYDRNFGYFQLMNDYASAWLGPLYPNPAPV